MFHRDNVSHVVRPVASCWHRRLVNIWAAAVRLVSRFTSDLATKRTRQQLYAIEAFLFLFSTLLSAVKTVCTTDFTNHTWLDVLTERYS